MIRLPCFLLPNRTIIVFNTGGTLQEFNQMYIRPIKLFKGITNTLEFEVRNNDQKKQSIVGMTPVVMLFDLEQQMILPERYGTLKFGTQHVFTVDFSAAELDMIECQQLRIAVKIVGNGVEQIAYGDVAYGLHIEAELFDGYNDRANPPQEITVFNYTYNYITHSGLFTSELAQFSSVTNDFVLDSSQSANVTVYPGKYRGPIQIEVTKDTSTASSNTWIKLDQVIDCMDEFPVDAVVTNDDFYTFIRFKFPGNNGYGASFDIRKEDGLYEVSLTQRGMGYTLGDVITIKGSRLGGDDGINDLNITVTAINSYPQGAMQKLGFTWEGVATEYALNETRLYRNMFGEPKPTAKVVDKIVVRS